MLFKKHMTLKRYLITSYQYLSIKDLEIYELNKINNKQINGMTKMLNPLYAIMVKNFGAMSDSMLSPIHIVNPVVHINVMIMV